MSAWIASIAQGDTGLDGTGKPITAATVAAVLTHGAAAGNTILCAVQAGGSRTLTGVSDNRGNTYTIDLSQTDGTTFSTYIVRCIVATGMAVGDTITFTFSGTNEFHQATADLYTGSFTLDQTATCTPATSNAPTTAATGTTARSVETVFAALSIGGGSTRPGIFTPAASTVRQSNDVTDTTVNTGRTLYSMDKDTTATGAQTVSGTFTGSDPWDIICATYYVAGGTGGGAQSIQVGTAGSVAGGNTISAKMIGFGFRGGGPDMSGTRAGFPWGRAFNCYDLWSNIEPTDNHIDLTGFNPTFQDAITNGYLTGIRIECSCAGTPSWAFSSNSLGPGIQHITTYTDQTDQTGEITPIPWDPNYRALWQRLCRAVQAYLNTSFGGKTYRDVCAFLAVSGSTAIIGTEMQVGFAGDKRNSAAWFSVAPTTAQLQAKYGQAWINASLDAVQLTSGINITVASGPVFGDSNRQVFQNVQSALKQQLTTSQWARMLFGPTDMSTDATGVSYEKWSEDAHQAIMATLALGGRTWAQSKAWPWISANQPASARLADQETAWLNDAVNIYGCEMVESNGQILNNIPGLETWCKNTLQPAILAQQWSINAPGVGNSAVAYGPAAVKYTGGTAQSLQAGIVPAQPQVYGPTLGGGAQILLAGAA